MFKSWVGVGWLDGWMLSACIGCAEGGGGRVGDR